MNSCMAKGVHASIEHVGVLSFSANHNLADVTSDNRVGQAKPTQLKFFTLRGYVFKLLQNNAQINNGLQGASSSVRR